MYFNIISATPRKQNTLQIYKKKLNKMKLHENVESRYLVALLSLWLHGSYSERCFVLSQCRHTYIQ